MLMCFLYVKMFNLKDNFKPLTFNKSKPLKFKPLNHDSYCFSMQYVKDQYVVLSKTILQTLKFGG